MPPALPHCCPHPCALRCPPALLLTQLDAHNSSCAPAPAAAPADLMIEAAAVRAPAWIGTALAPLSMPDSCAANTNPFTALHAVSAHYAPPSSVTTVDWRVAVGCRELVVSAAQLQRFRTTLGHGCGVPAPDTTAGAVAVGPRWPVAPTGGTVDFTTTRRTQTQRSVRRDALAQAGDVYSAERGYVCAHL
jgi:hypothetical protein